MKPASNDLEFNVYDVVWHRVGSLVTREAAGPVWNMRFAAADPLISVINDIEHICYALTAVDTHSQ